MATLLGVKKPHRAASLSRLHIVAANLPDGWLVNNGGEVVDRDPIDIADYIRLGGKWVDYGGYPMYYRQDAYANWLLGANGFNRFLMYGPNLGFEHTFRSDQHGFEFPRSLVVTDDQGIPPWIEPAWQLEHDPAKNIFSVFCLRSTSGSGGMYFHAYCEGTNGVNPYDYVNFIRLKAGLSQITKPVEKSALPMYLALGAGGYIAWLLWKESQKK